jgi:hypothetical protein
VLACRTPRSRYRGDHTHSRNRHCWPSCPPLGLCRIVRRLGAEARPDHIQNRCSPLWARCPASIRLVGGCLARRSTQVTVTQVTGRHGGFGQSWPSPLCGSAIRSSVRTLLQLIGGSGGRDFSPGRRRPPPLQAASRLSSAPHTATLHQPRTPTPPGVGQAAQHWSASSCRRNGAPVGTPGSAVQMTERRRSHLRWPGAGVVCRACALVANHQEHVENIRGSKKAGKCFPGLVVRPSPLSLWSNVARHTGEHLARHSAARPDNPPVRPERVQRQRNASDAPPAVVSPMGIVRDRRAGASIPLKVRLLLGERRGA